MSKMRDSRTGFIDYLCEWNQNNDAKWKDQFAPQWNNHGRIASPLDQLNPKSPPHYPCFNSNINHKGLSFVISFICLLKDRSHSGVVLVNFCKEGVCNIMLRVGSVDDWRLLHPHNSCHITQLLKDRFQLS